MTRPIGGDTLDTVPAKPAVRRTESDSGPADRPPAAALYDQHASHDFARLDYDQQLGAVRGMARDGLSDHEIAARTRLHVEQVRRLLAMQSDEAAAVRGARWQEARR